MLAGFVVDAPKLRFNTVGAQAALRQMRPRQADGV
jgi:hypothetical protein